MSDKTGGILVGLIVAGALGGAGIAMASVPDRTAAALSGVVSGTIGVPELRVTTAGYPLEVRRLHESGDGLAPVYPPNSAHETEADHEARFEFLVNGVLVDVRPVVKDRTLICAAGGTGAAPTIDCGY